MSIEESVERQQAPGAFKKALDACLAPVKSITRFFKEKGPFSATMITAGAGTLITGAVGVACGVATPGGAAITIGGALLKAGVELSRVGV